MDQNRCYTVFEGQRRLVAGPLPTMLLQTKRYLDESPHAQVLIFDDETGQQVDFDFSGSEEEVVARVQPPQAVPGPGRPRLGVVSREVSLLPRHWEWLEQQPNGISAALRRLVDEGRKREPAKERARRARDATSRFMWSMAGNLPNFEEATRALFAADGQGLSALIREWPTDIREQVERMVQVCDEHESAADGGAVTK